MNGKINVRETILEEIMDFLEVVDVAGLEDISLKTRAPQLDKLRFDVDIRDGRIIVNDNRFKPNEKYDFVVDSEGNLLIGRGHYTITGRAKNIKAAGELIIDDNGKITYINNESGHYEPNRMSLENIVNRLKHLDLFSDNPMIDKRY